MRSILIALAVSLLAPLAHATITTIPPQPAAGQPFTIRVTGATGCAVTSSSLLIAGHTLVISLDQTNGACLGAPVPFQQDVSVPALAAGRFDVVARLNSVADVERTAIDVAGTASHNVTPGIGGTMGGTVVVIDNVTCLPQCYSTGVSFGGTDAPFVKFVGTTAYIRAPRHAAGTVDINVFGDVVPSAFTYVAPDAFERVLVPLVLTEPVGGAFGSLWTTALTALNRNSATLLPNVDVLYPDAPIAPDTQFVPQLRFGVEHSPIPAAMFYVRKPLAENVTYSLRVRDLSRQSETYGTEIPVVRDRDVRRPPLDFLDVPSDDRFRTMLRVYAVDLGCCGNARPAASVTIDDGAQQLYTTTLIAEQPEWSIGDIPGAFTGLHNLGSPDFPLQPGYAQLDLSAIPELRGHDRVRVRVTWYDDQAHMWAFVSVTNNATQHVTTLTPH